MKKEEIIKVVNRLLVDELEIAEETLKPEASLKEDLEIDSLDFVDIIVLVEHEFGFKPLTEELKTIKTLQDFYQFIEGRIA